MEARNTLARLKLSSPIRDELNRSSGIEIIPRGFLPSPELGRPQISMATASIRSQNTTRSPFAESASLTQAMRLSMVNPANGDRRHVLTETVAVSVEVEPALVDKGGNSMQVSCSLPYLAISLQNLEIMMKKIPRLPIRAVNEELELGLSQLGPLGDIFMGHLD